MTTISHYDAKYFGWQKKRAGAEFGGRANRFKFQPYIKPTDRVVDFGCGGGFLLRALDCGERLGVEVNPVAREEAARQGVKCVPSPGDLPDEWADVIISNSALEHVEYPMGELRALLPKLKHGGRIVFVTPHETLASAWSATDINQHLHTWSPRNIGNLFSRAGFTVESVTASRLMWPPQYERLHRLLGERLFRLTCAAYRVLRLILWPVRPVVSHSSIITVARRP
jgi:SAM-dependent methyltransferase